MAKNCCPLHPNLPTTEAEKNAQIALAEEMVEEAAIRLLLKQPFFGTLLCGLRRIPTWSLPTMGVDGVSLFFNPTFTASLPKAELRGVICHEVLHIAYIHLVRRNKRQAGKWNAACDYAVDQVIREEAEMSLPSWVLYDPQYRDMSAEEIYAALPEKPGSGKKPGKKGQGGGRGEPQDGGNDDCPNCQQNSGDGGWKSWDSHMENSDVTEDDLIDKVVAAAEAAKQQGKLPAHIERFVNKLRNPKVDWRKFIRGRSLDIFNKRDYMPEIGSIMRHAVAKSMGWRSTWLPALGAEEARILAVVVDTSGSISPNILTAFASEIKGVMELATRTIIMSCDAEVHECKEVGKFDDLLTAVNFKGGGGTDFRPPFEKIKEMQIKPAMLVYFTDGYGTFPNQSDAPFPVLWAFTKTHNPAPFGESVVVEDADY